MPAEPDKATRLAYGVPEAAEMLGCSRLHLRNMISRGELRSVKLGRKVLIPAAAIDELLAATPEVGAE